MNLVNLNKTLITSFIFAACICAFAGSRTALLIGTTGDYEPFSTSVNSDFIGFDIDLMKAYAVANNKEVKFVKTTWPQLMSDLESGKFAIAISGISITEARKKTAYFSAPYFANGKMALHRCSDQRFKQHIDIKGANYVANIGGTNEAFLKKHITIGNKHFIENNQDAFKGLLNKTYDVMFTDRPEVLYKSKKHKNKLCIGFNQKVFNPNSLGILVKNKTLKLKIDQWLIPFMKTTRFKDLIKKYF